MLGGRTSRPPICGPKARTPSGLLTQPRPASPWGYERDSPPPACFTDRPLDSQERGPLLHSVKVFPNSFWMLACLRLTAPLGESPLFAGLPGGVSTIDRLPSPSYPRFFVRRGKSAVCLP